MKLKTLAILLIATLAFVMGVSTISNADNESALYSLSFGKNTAIKGETTNIPVYITTFGSVTSAYVTLIDENGANASYQSIYENNQIKNMVIDSSFEAGTYTLGAVTLEIKDNATGSTERVTISKTELAAMGIEYTLEVQELQNEVELTKISIDADSVASGTTSVPVTISYNGQASKIKLTLWEGEKYLHEVYVVNGQIDVSDFEAGNTFELSQVDFYDANGQVIKTYYANTDDEDLKLSNIRGNKEITIEEDEQQVAAATTQQESSGKDNTAANGSIPKAGAGIVLALSAIALVAFGISRIVKYKDLKGV